MAKMNKKQLRALLDATDATEARLRAVIGRLTAELSRASVENSPSVVRLMAQVQMTDTALHIATKEVRRLELELSKSALALQTITAELRDLKHSNIIRCEEVMATKRSWWRML
jgi:hypothetical protein